MASFEDDRVYAFTYITTETIYEILDALLDDIDYTILKSIPWTLKEGVEFKEKQLRSCDKIRIYLCELYRRNLLNHIDWCDIDPLCCSRCKKAFGKEDKLYSFMYNPEDPIVRCHECIKIEKEIKVFTPEECIQLHKNDEINKLWDVFHGLKDKIKQDYSKLKKVKKCMISCIESEVTSKLSTILNESMETESSEQCRLIRAGFEISKLTPEEQSILMNSLMY